MIENNLNHMIEQVAKDKSISRKIVIEALEEAMQQAAQKKREIAGHNIEAHYNEELGEVELYEFRSVVKEVKEPILEISFEEAREYDPEAQIGDELGIKLDTTNFGRIDAQTAKGIIIQKIREAERDLIYNEYRNRKGELITGITRRFERGDIIVDMGRTEAILPANQLMPNDNYRAGDRVQAYVVEVTKAQQGPQIVLSRTHDEFLVKLFEAEVPEIHEGIVRIESVARDPAARSKIAVSSRDTDVDPVGACVGMRGSRVQSVVQELRGEKIDIVPYDPEPARFVCNALLPAEVSRVIIDKTKHSMEVVVPDDQLSLAIGRKGQNVRLAAILTGWKLDIHSETKFKEMHTQAIENLKRIAELGETLVEVFYTHGLRSVKEVAEAEISMICKIPGVTEEFAEKVKKSAQAAYEKILQEEAEKAKEAEAEKEEELVEEPEKAKEAEAAEEEPEKAKEAEAEKEEEIVEESEKAKEVEIAEEKLVAESEDKKSKEEEPVVEAVEKK